MRLRSLALGTLALGVLVAPTADAAPKKAPKKYCNLHSDPARDLKHLLSPVNSSKALDILSSDVATGKSQLVSVLRVVSTNSSGESTWRLGYKWSFGFTANGVDYIFTINRAGGTTMNTAQDSVSVSVGGETLAAKAYTYKIEGNSFVFRVPRKGIKSLAKPKLVFTTFRAGSSAGGMSADNGSTETAKYPDRGLSCVKAV